MGGQHIGSPLNGLVGAGVGSNLLFLEAYFHHDDRVRVGGGVCAGGGRVGRSQISHRGCMVGGRWGCTLDGPRYLWVCGWVGGVVLGNLEQQLPRSESRNQKKMEFASNFKFCPNW